jgi:hypothetical protein
MRKTIRHKWIKQDGFRVHLCERCKVIRKWDDKFKKLMYQLFHGVYTMTKPQCVLPNTKL